MSLPPHLHLLIPSSTPSIHLEARLYVPSQAAQALKAESLPLSTNVRSTPQVLDPQLEKRMSTALLGVGVSRIITAGHPWSKLGGNMLDPVITYHLLSAIYQSSQSSIPSSNVPLGKATIGDTTLVLTFNVRGTGHSEGSAPLLTVGNEAEDFAAMENAVIRLCTNIQSIDETEQSANPSGQVLEIKRFAYSWGSLAALAAPIPLSNPFYRFSSTLLISPPITPFKPLSLITRSFYKTVNEHLYSRPTSSPEENKLWLVYGTQDQFTGATAFQSFCKDFEGKGLKGIEVDGADHFWRGEEEGEELQKAIRDWLDT